MIGFSKAGLLRAVLARGEEGSAEHGKDGGSGAVSSKPPVTSEADGLDDAKEGGEEEEPEEDACIAEDVESSRDVD